MLWFVIIQILLTVIGCVWLGFGPGAVFLAETATQRLIVALYNDTTMPGYPWPPNVPLTERNRAIVEAYRSGETLERIAADFEISTARAHQIIKNG